jgi:hypothetical protein
MGTWGTTGPFDSDLAAHFVDEFEGLTCQQVIDVLDRAFERVTPPMTAPENHCSNYRHRSARRPGSHWIGCSRTGQKWRRAGWSAPTPPNGARKCDRSSRHSKRPSTGHGSRRASRNPRTDSACSVVPSALWRDPCSTKATSSDGPVHRVRKAGGSRCRATCGRTRSASRLRSGRGQARPCLGDAERTGPRSNCAGMSARQARAGGVPPPQVCRRDPVTLLVDILRCADTATDITSGEGAGCRGYGEVGQDARQAVAEPLCAPAHDLQQPLAGHRRMDGRARRTARRSRHPRLQQRRRTQRSCLHLQLPAEHDVQRLRSGRPGQTRHGRLVRHRADRKPYMCAAIRPYDPFAPVSAAAAHASETGQRR